MHPDTTVDKEKQKSEHYMDTSRLGYVLDGIGNGYPKPFLPFYLVMCSINIE